MKKSLYILKQIKLPSQCNEESLKSIRQFFLDSAEKDIERRGFFDIDKKDFFDYKSNNKVFHYFTGLYIAYKDDKLEIVNPNTNDTPYPKDMKNIVNNRDRFICGIYNQHFFIAYKYDDNEYFESLFEAAYTRMTLSNDLSDNKIFKSVFHSINKLNTISSIEVSQKEDGKQEARDFLDKIEEKQSNLAEQHLFDKHFGQKEWKESSGKDEYFLAHLKDFAKTFIEWLKSNNSEYTNVNSKELLIKFINKHPNIYNRKLRRIEEACILAACCNSFNCEILGRLKSGDYSEDILLNFKHIKNNETVFVIVADKGKSGEDIFENIINPIIAKMDNNII